MVETEPAAGRASRYVVEVGLADGSTVEDELGEDMSSASLADLHSRLHADTFVAVGERLVIRSSDVRYVRIHEGRGC